MVDANANGGMVFAADVEETRETLLEALQFGGIFLVGIVYMLECACRIDIVTGIDPDLFGI